MHPYDYDRPEMEQYVPATARTVLEIGCSTGKFGSALAARGIEVVGIEPFESAAQQARQHLAKVVVGEFPDVANEVARDGGYDAVIYNDVLEHMVHPERALAATKALLAPGGVLIASIPNIRHVSALVPLLVRGQWRYTDIGILDRTHLRFFTRESIVDLFASDGWQIERIEGINMRGRADGGKSRIVSLLGLLSRRRTDDFFYLQYAVVARP